MSLLVGTLLGACGAAAPVVAPPPSSTFDGEARAMLAFYDRVYVALYAEASRAAWLAATDVSDAHTAARAASNTSIAAFTGNTFVIERARALLEHRAELDPLVARQLEQVLYLAADAPQTNPDLARRRVEAEARQSALLDGYAFCMRREGDACAEATTTNQIDSVLSTSVVPDERLRAWAASKEVGNVLRDGLIELRGLRNGVAREMGYPDFFTFQVSNYGITTPEMMQMLDRLVRETRPLFSALHCYARYELARRYEAAGDPPTLIPAHWVSNRWAQAWPGLVEGVDMDALVSGRPREWILEQAERFYVSMGFVELPDSFWERSDLYPVPEGNSRQKNDHASAWHLDLQNDVRSLMSVESTWEWFTTTHHELGHIYYFLEYARPEVPPVLRDGANRSYHEGMGDLIALAAAQEPYLREIGVLSEGQSIDQQRWLLDSALTGPIVFLPWAAGVMAHFEKALYADELPPDELNRTWWELVARYQGVSPPSDRPSTGCDACTKTHINDDPAQYYDYALANVLVFQLHAHICRNILGQDPRSCNYYSRREVGEFLRAIMRPGMSRDWREVLREHTGQDLTAAPMLEYYQPLMDYLAQANAGRRCDLPPL